MQFLIRCKQFLATAMGSLTYLQFPVKGSDAKSAGSAEPEYSHLNEAVVAQKVLAARVKVFADRSMEGAMSAPLGTLLMAWANWETAGWLRVSVWFVIFLGIQALNAWMVHRYRRAESHKTPDLLTQARNLILTNFLAGIGWGLAVPIFWVEGQLSTHMLNLAILMGVAGFSVLIQSAFVGAMVLFFGALLLPAAIQSFLQATTLSLQLGAGLVIFYALLLRYGSVVGQQLVSDLRSTVRNELLAERLRLALGVARQDWFEMDSQSGTMISSAQYAKPFEQDSLDAGADFARWQNHIHPEDRHAAGEAFADAIASGKAMDIEYRIRAGNDAWLWLRSVGRTVDGGPQGAPKRLVGVHADINDKKLAGEEITRLAYYDQLTHLPNRQMLNDRLRHAIAMVGRNKRQGALMMLDMDEFKVLNDSLGHDVGDSLLVEVAARLRSCVRSVDTVARQGGDEFVVMLEDLDPGTQGALFAENVARKILGELSKPYALAFASNAGKPGTYNHYCTASIGITLISGDSQTGDELMKRADTAMYQAKASGRNAIRFFDPEMQKEATARAVIENELRDAIARNQFLLFYQRQVDVAGRTMGFEALLRWQHPARGLVAPDQFISIAETTGLIQPIGRWVMETACRQLVSWASQPETEKLTISVNISAAQFRANDFIDQTLAVMELHGINPARLKLEITESVLLGNVDTVVGKLFMLKEKGIRFSLDDFGTGYSSLSYLKRLPIDQLKIDKSFIRDVLTDPDDAAITRTIIALAHSLELEVIAEGVETDAQRQFLEAHGCHAYQGYLFGRPMPIEGLQPLVSSFTA